MEIRSNAEYTARHFEQKRNLGIHNNAKLPNEKHAEQSQRRKVQTKNVRWTDDEVELVARV